MNNFCNVNEIDATIANSKIKPPIKNSNKKFEKIENDIIFKLENKVKRP